MSWQDGVRRDTRDARLSARRHVAGSRWRTSCGSGPRAGARDRGTRHPPCPAAPPGARTATWGSETRRRPRPPGAGFAYEVRLLLYVLPGPDRQWVIRSASLVGDLQARCSLRMHRSARRGPGKSAFRSSWKRRIHRDLLELTPETLHDDVLEVVEADLLVVQMPSSRSWSARKNAALTVTILPASRLAPSASSASGLATAVGRRPPGASSRIIPGERLPRPHLDETARTPGPRAGAATQSAHRTGEPELPLQRGGDSRRRPGRRRPSGLATNGHHRRPPTRPRPATPAGRRPPAASGGVWNAAATLSGSNPPGRRPFLRRGFAGAPPGPAVVPPTTTCVGVFVVGPARPRPSPSQRGLDRLGGEAQDGCHGAGPPAAAASAQSRGRPRSTTVRVASSGVSGARPRTRAVYSPTECPAAAPRPGTPPARQQARQRDPRRTGRRGLRVRRQARSSASVGLGQPGGAGPTASGPPSSGRPARRSPGPPGPRRPCPACLATP